MYYEPAIQYLQYAEDEYLKIQRSQAEQFEKDLETAEYDCGGLEKMLCPVCHGSGVVVQAGVFDEVYKTCPYSLGEGYLSCGRIQSIYAWGSGAETKKLGQAILKIFIPKPF